MQPLGHNRHGPKIGGFAPLGEGELGPHLTQRGQGRRLPACQVSSGSIQLFGHSTATLQTDRQTRQTGRQRSDSIRRTVFGRPFVKRFALYYRTVVCPVCLSRPKPHCVRWEPAPPKRGTASPQFSAHVYCAKMVAHLSYYCSALVQTVAQKSKCNVTCLFLYDSFITVSHNNQY